MTGKLIFKMEIFKFLRDKTYLITAGVIAILNILGTLFLLSMITAFSDPYNTNSYWQEHSELLGVFVLLFVFTCIGTSLFLIIYPFHIISMDYKNNVMAMMIAAGVNRRKLFFSKIGASIICTIGLTIGVTIIPAILFFIKIAQEVGIQEFFSQFSSLFYYLDTSVFWLILYFFVSLINTLIIMSAATIILKGSNLSILLYFGFSLLSNIIVSIFTSTSFIYNMTPTGAMIFQIIMGLISIGAFTAISLRNLETQNL